ncbi:MAG: hypothetical protein EAZ58_09120, partial [Flavobacterium sp.]
MFSQNTLLPVLMSISSVNEMVDPEFYPRGIQNTERLTTFFTKLKVLQSTQKGKLNIVHIGDS